MIVGNYIMINQNHIYLNIIQKNMEKFFIVQFLYIKTLIQVR